MPAALDAFRQLLKTDDKQAAADEDEEECTTSPRIEKTTERRRHSRLGSMQGSLGGSVRSGLGSLRRRMSSNRAVGEAPPPGHDQVRPMTPQSG